MALFPYDKVALTIHGLPADAVDLFVLADGRAKPLKVYVTKLLSSAYDVVPDITRRNQDIEIFFSSRYPLIATPTTTLDVQWVASDRYGVLTIDADGDWDLWWMDREHIRPPGMLDYFRRGRTATMELDAKARSRITDDQALKLLGLGGAKCVIRVR